MKTICKYSIEIPGDTEYAKRLDENNGNTFQIEVIKKKIHEVGIVFKILEENNNLLVKFKKVTGYLVFNIKMNFICKTRQVLDGHKTPLSKGSTCARVVLRQSVRIEFIHTILNSVDAFAANIRNIHL